MYQYVKSCVAVKYIYTDYFPCCKGVRQRETYHHFCFRYFLMTLKKLSKRITVMELVFGETISDNVLHLCLVLLVLLFAEAWYSSQTTVIICNIY